MSLTEHERTCLPDCKRIAAVCGVSVRDAYRLWCAESEMFAASWLFLPESDDELRQRISRRQEDEQGEIELF